MDEKKRKSESSEAAEFGELTKELDENDKKIVKAFIAGLQASESSHDHKQTEGK